MGKDMKNSVGLRMILLGMLKILQVIVNIWLSCQALSFFFNNIKKHFKI
jgi:hypothetical protein